MTEVVWTEFHIDVLFRPRLLVLFELLGNIVQVLAKGAGYVALSGHDNRLALDVPVAGIEGLSSPWHFSQARMTVPFTLIRQSGKVSSRQVY
jgi:hypothetical protein